MDKKEQELQKRLLATFKVEAAEHIQSLSSNLIELERPIAQELKISIIETIYRGAHSLKGAARAVNVSEIETVCQTLENVLSALKRSVIALSPALLDILHDTADFLNISLQTITDSSSLKKNFPISSIVQRLENVTKQKSLSNNIQVEQGANVPAEVTDKRTEVAEEKAILSDSVRIATNRLDSLLFQAEGLITAKLASAQRTSDICDIANELALLKKERAKLGPSIKEIQHLLGKHDGKNEVAKLQQEIRKLNEVIANETERFQSFSNKLVELTKASETNHRSLSSMVDGLLGDMKKALMLPISSVLDVFPKLARDLSKDQGKEVKIKINGSEIEVDRRILEDIRDPLIHLIRNSICHGIELPDIREKKGKSRDGQIEISIAPQSGGKIEISIKDDGAGIDLIKVNEIAKKLGVTNSSSSDALSLIFHSGLSTSSMITDIAGRGLGLAIVREKAEKLGGGVTVETQKDIGTTFHITVPLTLATFRGIHIEVNQQRFVIPATKVEEVIRIQNNLIKTIENRETIELRKEAIALVRLSDVLGLPRLQSERNEYLNAVILGSANKRIVFLVDNVLEEQEILVKTLGKQLSRVRNIAGATLLGAGKAIPILDVNDLLLSAVKLVTNPLSTTSVENTSAKRKSVLVAEDSITSRALLKNILESAGYIVSTASDGMEAFTQLKTKHFDLTISDVEMPRMSGFDLTAKIREDMNLKDLPVVLVTGLGSREHRERGVDVGANAYIVKSSFDQSNLLEIVRRLI